MVHQTYGYYAHGVGEETAVLPAGWKERVIAVRNENTNRYTGECLEVHDLAVSKLAAGREKDMNFVQALVTHRMVLAQTMEERLEGVERGGEMAREAVQARWGLILARHSCSR